METDGNETQTQKQCSYLEEAIKDRPANRSLEMYESYVKDGLGLTGALRINFLHETIPTASFNKYLETRNKQSGEIPVWVDLGCGKAKALQDYLLKHGSNVLLLGVDLLDFPEFNSPEYTGIEKSGLLRIKNDLNHEHSYPHADLITAIGVAQYLSNPVEMVAYAYANLKEGGLLLMSEPDSCSVFEEKVGVTSLTGFIISEMYDYLKDDSLARSFLSGTLGDGTTFLVIQKSSRLPLTERLLALQKISSERRGDFFVSRYQKK